MIIGITGTDGAGKGSVVKHLVETRNFVHYSARAIWIEEIERRGLEVTRSNMRIVANDLRKQHGNDYFVQESLRQKEADGTEYAVFDSLRAVAEAETLKAHNGTLIAVDADQRVRYERVQQRRAESNKVTFEQFIEHEKLESNDPDPHGMQKAKVIEMSDYVIENNGTLDELNAKVDVILEEIMKGRT